MLFNGGLLRTAGTVYSNGADFVVGNGTNAAQLRLTGSGTHTFQANLIVTNNGTLTGTGRIVVSVADAQGKALSTFEGNPLLVEVEAKGGEPAKTRARKQVTVP